MTFESTDREKPAWFASSELGRSIVDRVRECWAEEAWQSVTVVVAVSGGPDSVALLRVLDWLKRNQSSAGRLVIANFDHGWREESKDDAQFVLSLAKSLGWECVAGRAPVSESPSMSEKTARDLRYEFLQSVAADSGARYIATGHTADDQAETIMHRIVRGTGLRGLAGIPPFRVVNESLTLARPLLGVWRKELAEMLNEIDQPFRNDATNKDEKFTRNRIRQKLLPELRSDYNPEVDAALVRLGQLAAEVQSELSCLTTKLTECCDLSAKDEVVIDVAKLNSASPLIVRETFRQIWQQKSWPQQAMGFAEWELLEHLLRNSAQQKTATLPGNVAVVFENGRMILRRCHSS